MNPQFDHHFLNQYLDKKMSPVELEAFEKRLSKEPVLKAELNAMKRDRGMEVEVEMNMEAKTEAKTEQNGVKRKPNYIFLIIGIILLMLAYYISQQ